MKVICINATNFANPNTPTLLAEGNIYTPVRVVDDPCGLPHYELKEIGKDFYYATFRFIPCSEIDEMELVNEMAEVNHI